MYSTHVSLNKLTQCHLKQEKAWSLQAVVMFSCSFWWVGRAGKLAIDVSSVTEGGIDNWSDPKGIHQIRYKNQNMFHP